ncbi:chemotaxis protein CheR [cyanobacterium TDX16]|nr:chemotaxis protein CheR [cyanobacterium TDX16]
MLKVCNKQTTDISNINFQYLCQLVYQHAAIVLDASKDYLAELHLKPIAETTGFDSLNSFVEHLRSHPFGSLHVRAIEALSVTETSFFRDRYPFEVLKNFTLPELISRRAKERSLKIWCGACSSGQEPYSLAILIREHFPLLTTWDLQIIASDFSSQILARARQGCYRQWEIQRGLPAELREKYFQFQQQQQNWQIKDQIRQMVEFRQINLIHPWLSMPAMDVIFLRNVLIYFDTDTKKSTLKKVRKQLRPDGYLFLGGGETTIYLDDSFERIQQEGGVCYRLR